MHLLSASMPRFSTSVTFLYFRRSVARQYDFFRTRIRARQAAPAGSERGLGDGGECPAHPQACPTHPQESPAQPLALEGEKLPLGWAPRVEYERGALELWRLTLARGA